MEVDNMLKEFLTFTDKPEKFLEVQSDAVGSFKKTTKDVYDFTRQHGLEQGDQALPELLVQGFDDEQIWQQLELQNDLCMQEMLAVVSKLSAVTEFNFNTQPEKPKKVAKTKKTKTGKNKTVLEEEEEEGSEVEAVEEALEEALEENDDDEDSELEKTLSHIKEKGLFDNPICSDDSDEEKELEALLRKAQAQPPDDDDDDDDDDDEDENINFDFETKSNKRQSEEPKKKKHQKSVVDDQFFHLYEMADFLDQEDAKEERQYRGGKAAAAAAADDGESSDEEDLLDNDYESAMNIMYSDFFDPPNEGESKKKVSFEDEDEEEEEEEVEGGGGSHGDSDEDEEEMDKRLGAAGTRDLFEDSDEGELASEILGHKSSYERRQERLKKIVGEMEEASLADKPWQLKGEITATDRPENSLLQEDLDFDATTRAAPVITEETTKSLEDIIKQRVKDKAWDDVERKEKPTESAYEYKKKVVLDQEKSKMSLSQIYEQEYIKQKEEEQEETEDPRHEQIRKSMQSLFIKLDALSNYFYTPKPAAPEVKIVSNLPSIIMEEALPVAASDAATLAPEEIKEKSREELKGATERSTTDKKRARRRKKQQQSIKAKVREVKEKQTKTKGKPGKKQSTKELQKLAKSSGVTIMKETHSKSLTSSSQFFNQLQDQVSSHIQAKKNAKSNQPEKQVKSSAKLKL